MSVIATPFLNQEFVTALADSGMSNTNVVYFEGRASDMVDSAIHTATGMSAKSSKNSAMMFFVHGQNNQIRFT